jgi:hypothetical protein
MKTILRRTSLIVLTLAAVVAVFSTAGAQTAPETWQIEVDVFSGRPNPKFTVTGADLAQVKDRMGRAKMMAAMSAGAASIRPSILGYRGIIIHGTTADQKQVLADAEVFAARILRRGPGAPALLDDTATGLESLLISLGVNNKAIPPEALPVIRQVVP